MSRLHTAFAQIAACGGVKAAPSGMTGSERVRGQRPTGRLPLGPVAVGLGAGALGAAVLPEVEGRSKQARLRSAQQNLAKAQADLAREQSTAGRARITKFLLGRADHPAAAQIDWPVVEHLTPDYNPRNLVNMLEFWVARDKHPVTRKPLGVVYPTAMEVSDAARNIIGVPVPSEKLTRPRPGQFYHEAIRHPIRAAVRGSYGSPPLPTEHTPVETVLSRAVAEEPIAQRVIGAVGRALREVKAAPPVRLHRGESLSYVEHPLRGDQWEYDPRFAQWGRPFVLNANPPAHPSLGQRIVARLGELHDRAQWQQGTGPRPANLQPARPLYPAGSYGHARKAYDPGGYRHGAKPDKKDLIGKLRVDTMDRRYQTYFVPERNAQVTPDTRFAPFTEPHEAVIGRGSVRPWQDASQARLAKEEGFYLDHAAPPSRRLQLPRTPESVRFTQPPLNVSVPRGSGRSKDATLRMQLAPGETKPVFRWQPDTHVVPATPPHVPVRQVLEAARPAESMLARLARYLRRSPYKAYDRGGYRPPGRKIDPRDVQRDSIVPDWLARTHAQSSADTRFPGLGGHPTPMERRVPLPPRLLSLESGEYADPRHHATPRDVSRPWSDWEAGDLARMEARDELSRVPVSRVLQRAKMLQNTSRLQEVLAKVAAAMRESPFKAAPYQAPYRGSMLRFPGPPARGLPGSDPAIYRPGGVANPDPGMAHARDGAHYQTFGDRSLLSLYRRGLTRWIAGNAGPEFTSRMDQSWRGDAGAPLVRVPTRAERARYAHEVAPLVARHPERMFGTPAAVRLGRA